ncbi:MAG: dTDP-4-dehydrorhamnose 3,5-epimerase family protein [Patescibacteria group bacterium]|nr:dTDP-4-dehydrorhamnose 3,5-epimerase family protein [Patescibacteria group bacterium]
MISGVIIKKLEKLSDSRGYLAEFWRSDESDYKPAMSYLSVTKPGIARGPHEHKFQSDFFIFPGPGIFELFLWDNREDSETRGQNFKLTVGENEPTMVIVPPGVVHGYKCISTEPGLVINLPDKLYKGEGKKEEVDEIRWEADPVSPFKIV